MPVMPVGASATGIDTFSPIMVVSSERLLMSTSTRCLSLIFWKSSSLAR